MKIIRRIIIAVIIIQIIAMAIIMGNSIIQDMTLATDEVVEFDNGWKLVREDGSVEKVSTLPYLGESKKGEVITFENVVKDNMCGKTINFLSADKTLQVFVGDKLVYSFGMEDQRKIGHTPGSVMVFADIPADCAGETIRIVAESPYDNYASYFTDIVVGERDVAILYFLKNRTVSLYVCFGIFVCGMIILSFAIIHKFTKQRSADLFSIALYFLIMCAYHTIETKVPMIFYGNQFLYSNLVFVSLMLSPLFCELYVYVISNKYQKIMQALIAITCLNIVGQLLLQGLNILDFMEMAFISHCIFSLAIIMAFLMELERHRRRRKVNYSFLGVSAMLIFGGIDLLRCYTIKVGDLGKYSRIGAFLFGICTVIACIKNMVQKEIQYAENEKVEIFSSEIIRTLVTAIDAKDIYTKGHSTRVAEYSAVLAEALGWSEEKINKVRYKALLHDVGKIGIPDRVLNKADRLSDEEFEIIKSHTTLGAEILKGVSSLEDMYLVARHHHERYDGNGYPDKLKGQQIPQEARVVGIVDAYDAMSSDRAYRKALPDSVIQSELIKGRGTQFDPTMTDVFVRLFDEGKLSQLAHNHESKDTIDDVSKVINEMIESSTSPGAIKMDKEDMGKVYQYIEGLHTRYGIDYNTVLISLTWDESVQMTEVAEAMKAMEYSIVQSLRKVDVMTRISESQYLIVLTEAHSQNLQMIIERVFASYFRNSQNTKIEPTYEVNKSI